MEKKTETAIDTIFAQSAKIEKLEMSVRLLDDKLNMILRILENPERKMKEKVFMKGETSLMGNAKADITTMAQREPAKIHGSAEAVDVEEVEAEEVMEIRSVAPTAPKSAIVAKPAAVPMPAIKPATVLPTISAGDVVVADSNIADKHERITCIVRGKYDSRHGNISNVGIAVKNHAGKTLKNTKTNATGDWLVLLQAGEYTVEFARIGQTPVVRSISIMPGKKEMEILI